MDTALQDTHRLIQVARGRIPADMVVVNGLVANVYTKEVLKDCAVTICRDRIARVGPDADHTIGNNTQVIDATGKVVIPGLIEGHTHLAGLYTAAEFISHAMLGGTTSIITETMEPFSVGGVAGVIDFLESFKEQPIKFWATAPPMVSISKAARGIDLEDLKTLLGRDDILGLGETYWQAIIQEPDYYLPIMQETLKAGKLLEGHTAGASFDKLNAYAACQVTSCHEPINAREVTERLRMGFYVMVREGSIRRDLAAIAKVKDANIDLRRMILSTDGVTPADLLEKGYMDYLLQKAIDCGFNPLDAIQMATLNVAEHFRLDHMIGGIAPGRQADLLILPTLQTIRPTTVISNGQVIVREGKPMVAPRKHQYSSKSVQSVHL